VCHSFFDDWVKTQLFGIRLGLVGTLIEASQHCDTGSTKNNSRISCTCTLGMKTDMRVLLAVFYETVSVPSHN
jgi:hypothetical protein